MLRLFGARYPTDSERFDLMKLADQALYLAKRGGRNLVVCGLPAKVAPRAARSPARADEVVE